MFPSPKHVAAQTFSDGGWLHCIWQVHQEERPDGLDVQLRPVVSFTALDLAQCASAADLSLTQTQTPAHSVVLSRNIIPPLGTMTEKTTRPTLCSFVCGTHAVSGASVCESRRRYMFRIARSSTRTRCYTPTDVVFSSAVGLDRACSVFMNG